MTEPPRVPAPVAPLSTRLHFALLQAGVLALCLIVGGEVVARLRPDVVADRGAATTPFLWAAVLWTVVLVFHALAFERSQMHLLEREPMWISALVALATLIIGIANLTSASKGPQVVWLAAQAAGWFVFWWGALSLIRLIAARPGPPSNLAEG